MASIPTPKTDGLFIATGVVLGLDIFLKAKQESAQTGSNVSKKGNKQNTKAGNEMAKRLLFAGIFLVVSGFMKDQVPEFMGPFLILVIVTLLVKDAPLIKSTFDQIQKGNI